MRSIRRTIQTAVAVAIASVASSALTGCFKASLSDARFRPGEQHEVWVDQYVFGLVGSPELDIREFCRDGPAQVGVFENAWAFGVTLLSLGIYTPRVATIACIDPRPPVPAGRSSAR
jgi:hypothetical protein